MRVNEVLVAAGGGPDAQFVELRDYLAGGESFPDAEGYRLAAFDSTGALVNTAPLSATALDLADEGEYYVASPAAAAVFPGQPPDALLPNRFMPAASGKVCLETGMGSRQIHCVAYGCPVAAGADRVLLPANGQTAQRQPGGSYQIAAPTPKRLNNPGLDATCIGDGPGGGPGPGVPVSPDKIAPRQVLSFRRRQDVDKLSVTLRLSENGLVTVRGAVTVPGGAARRFKFRPVVRDLGAGFRRRFRLRLGRKARKAIRNGIDEGKKVRAAVRITAEDLEGNTSTKRPKIRVKD